MDLLQNGIEQLNSPAPLFLFVTLFLIASVAGWYASNAILWLRR
jgi:hypothetical protein